MKRSLRISFIVIGVFAIALYAVALGGTFVYDDVAVVQKDERLADPHRWAEFWTDSYNGGVDNLYRPLVSMTYAIEYWLHPNVAWWYHACNTLLHATVSVLVGCFAWKLARALEGGSPCRSGRNQAPAEASQSDALQVAIISGLLFAAHPVHVEAVANIVGRAELMCAIATLGALTLAIGPLRAKRVIGIWLCSAAAILCKEQGILAVLMVGVIRYGMPVAGGRQSLPLGGNEVPEQASRSDALHGMPRSRAGSTLFALLTLNVAAIVVLREDLIHLKFWWDRKFLDPWIQPLSDSVGIDRWLVPVTICGRYLGLLVAPVTLRIDYGGQIVPGVFDPRDPFLWLGVGAIGLWCGLLALAWKLGDRLIVISLLLFAISYAVISNWPTIIGVNMAERLVYLPSAFFVMIVASLLVRLPRRAMIVVVTIVLLLFSIRTVSYAWRWNDRLAFYEYEARVEPRSMQAILLSMQECEDRGKIAQAETYARAAVTLDPTYGDAWLRLADFLIRKGALDEAQAALDRAKAIRMTGKVGSVQGRLDEKRAATTKPAA